MSDDRRYDEQEIAEILERATTSEATLPSEPATVREGLTLAQLQEIGSEVGIAPASIADAARAISGRELAAATKTFLGTPRSVSRIVPIDRALNDDEWTRLVVDLRETFDAFGKVKIQGPLRSWTNGNLQVLVEPDGDRYRVRMRTHKGNVTPLAAMSVAFICLAVISLLQTLVDEAGFRGLLLAAMFGVAGVGQLGYIRATLPGWAIERAAQMEGLAERIPLLLKD